MPDSIFTRTYAPEGGPRVRLRLARPSDHAAVCALLRARGVEADELTVRRLLAFDPSTRTVLAAFAPLDGTDTLVGLGAIELAPGADVDALVVDERIAAGLGECLASVLRGRADRRAA